jgi:hypothetical protein
MAVDTTTAADTTPSDESVTDFFNRMIDRIDLQSKLLYAVIRIETVACTIPEFDWRCVFGETITRIAQTGPSTRNMVFRVVRTELPLEHNADMIEGALTWEQVMDRVNA